MGLSSNIDLTEVLFTLFWLFFIGLIIYIRREDKREGYPLESEGTGDAVLQGFPAVPSPKTFNLRHGGTVMAPAPEPPSAPLAAEPSSPFRGSPLIPTGDPMLDGLGAAAYAQRGDAPDLTMAGKPRIVPMRSAEGFKVDHRDPDPRGMSVLGADKVPVGKVTDVWVDLVEPMICFFEVQLEADKGGQSVMLPIGFAKVNKRQGHIDVHAIYSHQFANIPGLASTEQISLLEEDKITAYFAGGTLYADAKRSEPLL